MEIIEEYKNQLSPDLYNETKKIIEEKTKQDEEETKTEDETNPTVTKKKSTRGRPKKVEE